ncbi:MAG TPA: cation diffusion facilitator family transporter [Pararhizobium sp.]|nr:cation diffusion facilitator family transporter [Pararhizobium sp.]
MSGSHGHSSQGHEHDHGHHGHSHEPANFGRAFAIGIALNIAFVAIEALYGFLAQSMALLADAGHNLSDVLGLAVAWVAFLLSSRPPSRRFTYGFGKSSILAALFNALILLVAVGAIAAEAVQRLIAPEPVAGVTVMIVAGIGILINGITAALFASGRQGDINIRGAYLHMLADAGVSVGVVLAGFVIMETGLTWIDPAVSLLIAAVIFLGTWGLLRDSVSMSMAGVPPGIDLEEVNAVLKSMPGVADVHDLHVWPMSTTETALTCHLLMPGGYPGTEFLRKASHELEERFDIVHPTFQIETDPECRCSLAPADVV